MRIPLTYSLILLLFGNSATLLGCRDQNELAPRLGDPLDCAPSHDTMFAISPAQFVKGCSISKSGVKYFVGSIDGKTIDFVSTQDSNFRTPEGVRLGSSIREVILAGGTQIYEEPSWAYLSRLPSGWSAKFGGAPGMEIRGTASLKCDSVVHELFLRRY